jgi:hypothetical protein
VREQKIKFNAAAPEYKPKKLPQKDPEVQQSPKEKEEQTKLFEGMKFAPFYPKKKNSTSSSSNQEIKIEKEIPQFAQTESKEIDKVEVNLDSKFTPPPHEPAATEQKLKSKERKNTSEFIKSRNEKTKSKMQKAEEGRTRKKSEQEKEKGRGRGKIEYVKKEKAETQPTTQSEWIETKPSIKKGRNEEEKWEEKQEKKERPNKRQTRHERAYTESYITKQPESYYGTNYDDYSYYNDEYYDNQYEDVNEAAPSATQIQYVKKTPISENEPSSQTALMKEEAEKMSKSIKMEKEGKEEERKRIKEEEEVREREELKEKQNRRSNRTEAKEKEKEKQKTGGGGWRATGGTSNTRQTKSGKRNQKDNRNLNTLNAENAADKDARINKRNKAWIEEKEQIGSEKKPLRNTNNQKPTHRKAETQVHFNTLHSPIYKSPKSNQLLSYILYFLF